MQKVLPQVEEWGECRAEHHLPCLWVGRLLIGDAGEGVGLCC